MKHIETHLGVGAVKYENGDNLATTRYEIDVFQHELQNGALGLKTVVGVVRDLHTFRFHAVHLVLELEDGHDMPSYIKNDAGEIAVHGDIELLE